MTELVSEKRLEELWVMEGRQRNGNEAKDSFERGDDDWSAYLAGARAALAEMGVARTIEIKTGFKCTAKGWRTFGYGGDNERVLDWCKILNEGCDGSYCQLEDGPVLIRAKKVEPANAPTQQTETG